MHFWPCVPVVILPLGIASFRSDYMGTKLRLGDRMFLNLGFWGHIIWPKWNIEKLSSEDTRINSKSLPLGWNDFNMWWFRIFIHILQSKTPWPFLWPCFKLHGVGYPAVGDHGKTRFLVVRGLIFEVQNFRTITKYFRDIYWGQIWWS